MSLPEPTADTVHRARQGDAQAFENIVSLYERIVYNFAWRMTFHAEDAREMVQEVFLRLFGNFHQFAGDRRFGPWFMRLAVNACINESKRRKRERDRSGGSTDFDPALNLPSRHPDASQVAEQVERKIAVRKAIEDLREPYRSVVCLRYVEDLSYKEIGEILEIPEGTIKARLFRAREALREKLENVGIRT